MLQKLAKLFSSFGTNFDLVLVAIVVGEIERGQTFMTDQTPEESNCTFGLNVVATQAEVHECLVVVLKHAGQLLQACVREAVLANVEL